MIYQIIFKDKTIYKGGTYTETLWNSIPNKEIIQISIILPDGNILTLCRCEQYNHIMEATQDIYNSNKFTLRYQYIMGKIKDKVISYRITLFQLKDSKFKIGDITRREFDWGKEYSGKPTNGWKKGIVK